MTNTNEHNHNEISLTPREQQIVSLIAAGKTAKEISHQLNISKGTVYTHRDKIAAKLGITGQCTAGITKYAIEQKLIS